MSQASTDPRPLRNQAGEWWADEGMSIARIARLQGRSRELVQDDVWRWLCIEGDDASDPVLDRAMTAVSKLLGIHEIGPAWREVQNRVFLLERSNYAFRELLYRTERERRQAWAAAMSGADAE